MNFIAAGFARILTGSIFALLVGGGPAGIAQDCPDLDDYAQELQRSIEQEKNAAQKLQALKAGFGAPPEGFDEAFVVDLADSQAVSARRDYLASAISSNFWPLPRPGQVSELCFESSEKIMQLESELRDRLKNNAQLRIEFLSLPESEREILISQSRGVNVAFREKSQEIDDKVSSTEKSKEQIDESKQKVTAELENAESAVQRRTAEARLALESYRSRLAEISLNWLAELKYIVDRYQTIAARVEEVESRIKSPDPLSDPSLQLLYSKITGPWRTLIDDGYNVYGMMKTSSAIDPPPEITASDLSTLPETDRQEIIELYRVAIAERQKFLDIRVAKVGEHFDDFYQLLARASRVRSDVLTVIADRELEFSEYEENLFADIVRELLAIPFRFAGIVYQKFIGIKLAWDSGFWGLFAIAKNIFALLIIFLIPFGARWATDRLVRYLDDQRAQILRQRRGLDRKMLSIALWVQRLIPYLPWLMYGLLLRIFQVEIRGSAFDDLEIVVPIVGYVLIYKIFRLLVIDLFHSIRSLAGTGSPDTSDLVNSTSKTVGYFFMFAFVSLHLTEQTVDQGLIYRGIAGVIELFGLIVCAVAAYRWRGYLAPAVRSVFPGSFGEFLGKHCEGSYGIFAALPTLLAIIGKLLFDWGWEWFSNLEISKRFLAKVYRKKIESIVGESKPTSSEILDSSYTDLFDGEGLENPELLVAANQKAYQRIKAEIEGWLSSEEDDQSVALYGEKGIGKTTLLDQLSFEFKELNVIRLEIPPKIWQRENLANYISENLGLEKTDNLLKAVLEYNKNVEKKTLILVDNAHNLFLGRFGGFEALHAYIEAVNLKTENMFWCSVFNEYAWAYLRGVLGTAQYLRTEVYLDSWTDDAIKELILKRHRQSNMQLSYDQIILASRSAAVHSEAYLHAEEQFFRLLWEQSNGNPRVALYLWKNCLRPRGSSTLRVGLPERPESSVLATLDDNCWFVLASIVKHDNLTRNEAVSTTNLAWPQVAHAIKLGMENKLLHRDGSRYRLHFTHQFDVLRQLRMKNFVYGVS